MGIVSTTKPMPTRHNGLFTTNRGELEYPSLWDGLELAYFPHIEGGGATLKGYGDLATNATLHGTYSWIGSEIGMMWEPDGSDGYANTNNTEFLDKIDNDFSYVMWTKSTESLTNNERWWGSEDTATGPTGPRLYAVVKEASGTLCSPQTNGFDTAGTVRSELWRTTDEEVDTGTRPFSFIASIDWSSEDAILSVNGGSKAVTQSGTGSIGTASGANQPIYIGARNHNGTEKNFIKAGFSTIAWWSRQLSGTEHRILGNDPFVLCRRMED